MREVGCQAHEDAVVLNAAAILFDIDGTLVDSTAAVERCWRVWSNERNIDADAVLAICHGRRAEDTIAVFVDTSAQEAAVLAHMELELNDMNGVVALPAAARLLQGLPAYRWAAVTSGARQLMEARLEVAGLPLPSVFISGTDVGTGKPSPEGYLAAAEALGVDPSQCVVIEDAPAGIQAGLSAGATVIGVSTSHDASFLSDATVVISDLRSIAIDEIDVGFRLTVHTKCM